MKNWERELKTIFELAVKHINKKRADVLSNIDKSRLPNIGLEGWLKIELLHILVKKRQKVVGIKSKGPDLILKDIGEIELKAASNFPVKHIANGVKYNCPCLFLVKSKCTDKQIKQKIDQATREIRHNSKNIIVKPINPKCLKGWFMGLIR